MILGIIACVLGVGLFGSVVYYQGETSDLRETKQRLNENLEELNAEYEQFEDIFEELEDNYEKKKEILAETEQDLKEKKENYRDLNQEYQEVKEEYSSLEQSFDEIKDNYENLKEHHNVLENSYSSLQTDYDNLQKDYEYIKTELEKLEENYDNLLNRYVSLKADYENLKSEKSDNKDLEPKRYDISPSEANEIIENENILILDVRTPNEFGNGHIPGALLSPVSEINISSIVETLSKEKPILVYCKSGFRSTSAANYLVDEGFIRVYNLSDGILAWKEQNYPTV